MRHVGMTKPAFGERIQSVRVSPGVECVRHQLGVVVVAKRNVMLREYHGVEFDIEANLQDCR